MTAKEAQYLLGYLGYYIGEVDGKWGQLSRSACRAFQRSFGGIAVTGTATEETGKALRHAVAYGMPARKEAENFWDGIRYWTREEFRCRCGEYHAPYCNGFPVEPDRTLVELVDDIRHDLGAPGIRSSGIRCPQHNADEGGVVNSRHLKGKALDFMIAGKSAGEVLARAQADKRCRYAYIIGSGPYVHVDVE
jgi:hypothetical protein